MSANVDDERMMVGGGKKNRRVEGLSRVRVITLLENVGNMF